MKTVVFILLGLTFNELNRLGAEEEKPLPSVFIGDGTRVSAVDALRSAAFATKQFGGELCFLDDEGETWSIQCTSEDALDVCFGCFASIGVNVGGYSIDGEKMDYTDMVERIEIYSEAARLTASRPIVLINASSGVSGIYLVKLLNAMKGTGDFWIVRPVPALLESSSVTNPETELKSPRRQAERQPYKIELELSPIGQAIRLPKESSTTPDP